MSFMESPLVRDELECIEIMKLEIEVLSELVESGLGTEKDLLQYLETMYECLYLQSIVWTRMSLSDDVSLTQLKEDMIQNSLNCGRNPYESVSEFYRRNKEELSKYIKELYEELGLECPERNES